MGEALGVSVPEISRGPEAVAVAGLRAPSLAALLATPINRPWIVADMSLGAWRGHAVATQLEAILGLESSEDVGVSSAPSVTGDLGPYADTVGAFIDVESLGDRSVRDALRRAKRVAAAIAGGAMRSVVVFIPRFDLTWEREDALFLSFLSRALRDSPTLLLFVASDKITVVPRGFHVEWHSSPDTPGDPAPAGLLPLVPGIMEPAIAQVLGSAAGRARLLELPGGSLLVPPEWRSDPRLTSRLEFDRLAVAAHGVGWLRAYGRVHGNNIHVKAAELCEQAWQRRQEGGVGIALRLLERAIECSRSPTERALCLAHAQGARIPAQRFSEAANAPEPPASAPAPLRGFLLQTKGWGLVMTGRASAAQEYFLASDAHLVNRGGGERERLYLLNICALARLRTGDIDGAFELERSIETSLAGLGERDAHLDFVNSINLARLHRRIGAWGEARRYYDRAFATVDGVRSECDAVYANFCAAVVELERAQNGAAFPYLLRAALHWVSCDVPEALPRRAATGILGRDLGDADERTEDVSAALASRLLIVARDVLGGFDSASHSRSAPVFRRYTAAATIHRVVGGPGFSLLVADGRATPAFDGPEHRGLRQLVLAIVRRLVPAEALRDVGHFSIDDRSGREMAMTPCELRETALRVRARETVIEGCTRRLDDEVRLRLERHLRVERGPAVARRDSGADGARVHFRRCRGPHRLSDVEARWVTESEQVPDLEGLARRLGQSFELTLSLARRLEESRTVVLVLPQQREL